MSDFDKGLIDLARVELQPFVLPEFSGKNIRFDVLRLDKIHPVISGNKWFKLKYHVQQALENKAECIVTFGGAWSNHIVATAFMARLHGLRAIGIIRGERSDHLSATLKAAEDYGMFLEFVSRESYRKKDQILIKPAHLSASPYVIPEGGAGPPGIHGSEEILSLVPLKNYLHIICCIGTGTMYQGLINASLPQQQITGITVLKGMFYAPATFTDNPVKLNFCKIITDYHFGGYAKKTPELIDFMNYCYRQTRIPSDFVYTGKLLFACMDLATKDYFPRDSRILIIHSGGLQGNASLAEGTLLF